MAQALPSDMVRLDGRKLEGGGQIVRIAVALSALTGRAVTIDHIRGNRSGKRGLKASHLAAITTLGELSGSQLVKAQVGSRSLGFYPPRHEDWKARQTESEIDIRLPTPGSVFLVFQALYPYLLHSASADRIHLSIVGGTNVSSSPSYDYVSQVLAPNFARVGLPPLSVSLEKRGWSSSHGPLGLGKVIFGIDTLRSRNGGTNSPGHEVKIPLLDLHKCRRGAVTKIDITVLAPDDQLDRSDSTMTASTNSTDSCYETQHDACAESKDEEQSDSIRQFTERYTHKTLRRGLKELPRAVLLHRSSNEPDLERSSQSHVVPIETHTTETTHRRSCLYVLIVAHTSTGFRVGRDALYGALTDSPKSKKERRQKRPEGQLVSKVTDLVDNCVEDFLRELHDPQLQAKLDDPENAQHRPCVDEHTRDQLVIFEALGALSKASPADGESEDERCWSLHTKTAQWVCREILGQGCIR